MTTKFKQPGQSIEFTAAADLKSNDVLLIGGLRGVVLQDVKTGEKGSLGVEGVYQVAKDATVAFSQGDAVYWDAVAGNANDTNTNPHLGYAIKAELAAATTLEVKLAPSAATN